MSLVSTMLHTPGASASALPSRRTPRTTARPLALALAFALGCAFGSSAALADSFTYHGNLEQAGAPANGAYDLKLTLYSAENGGQVLAGPIQAYGVDVYEGSFSTNVDFGALANLDRTAWLGVEVKAGSGGFEPLAGRSPIEPAASACPGSWTLDGNAGNPANAFIGTADAKNVYVKANSQDGIVIIPKASGTPAVILSPWTSGGGGIGSTSVSYSSGAMGDYSFAGGYRGEANYAGSFVWGGDISAPAVADTAKNQFIIGASGGVGINTSGSLSNGQDLTIKARGTATKTGIWLKGKGSTTGILEMADGIVGGVPNGSITLTTHGNEANLILTSNSLSRLGAGGYSDVIVNWRGVGIGRAPTATNLEVNGNASKSTAGSWLANSDGRIKQDIQPIAGALDTLAKIRPVTFRYTDTYASKHDGIDGQRYYNVIAQEFAEVFPEAVKGSGEYLDDADKTAENEILQVDTYPALITTVAAVQELAAENAALKAQLKSLSDRLDKLAAKAGR